MPVTVEDVKRAVDNDHTYFARSAVELVKILKDPDKTIKMNYEDMDIHWECPEVYEHWVDVKSTMKATKTNNAGIVLDKRGLLPPFFIVWADPMELVEAINNLLKVIKNPLYDQFIITNRFLLEDQLKKTMQEAIDIQFPNLVEALCEPLRRSYFVEEEMKKIFTKVPIDGPSGYSMNLDKVYDGLGIDLRKDGNAPPPFEMIDHT